MDEKYDKALNELRDLEKSDRVNEYERALMHQTYAYVYYAMGEYAKSVRSFEAVESGILQPNAELNVLFNLGQLYVVLGRTDQAIATLERWFRLVKNPGPPAQIALANAYVQAERFDDALPLVEKACASSSEPAESWLQLLVALHTQASRWKPAATALEALLERFPRKTYWSQLSAVYAQLGRDLDSMIALELANVQAPLSDSTELTRLAQLLLHNEIPYKAAVVLQRGITAGNVAATRDSYELLATSLLQAREIEKALEPLEKAASLSSDGELWLRLAQVRIAREEWTAASKALAEAQRRGGLDRPGLAELLVGITRLHRGELDPAEEAFERARTFEYSRRSANEYISYLEDVRARNASLADPAGPARSTADRSGSESRSPVATASDPEPANPPAAPAGP
jgi:tetratricopeptide (TPR) repeat protein